MNIALKILLFKCCIPLMAFAFEYLFENLDNIIRAVVKEVRNTKFPKLFSFHGKH